MLLVDFWFFLMFWQYYAVGRALVVYRFGSIIWLVELVEWYAVLVVLYNW